MRQKIIALVAALGCSSQMWAAWHQEMPEEEEKRAAEVAAIIEAAEGEEPLELGEDQDPAMQAALEESWRQFGADAQARAAREQEEEKKEAGVVHEDRSPV